MTVSLASVYDTDVDISEGSDDAIHVHIHYRTPRDKYVIVTFADVEHFAKWIEAYNTPKVD